MDVRAQQSRAVQAVAPIFESTRELALEIAGTPVRVSIEPDRDYLPKSKFDPTLLPDGQEWPPCLVCNCQWEGGGSKVVLGVQVNNGRAHVFTRLASSRRGFLWIELTGPLRSAGADGVASIAGSIGNAKRYRSREAKAAQRTLQDQLKRVIRRSGLPMSRQSVEVFQVRLGDGAVLPSPRVALERLLTLVLYKLDFYARREAERAERGAPLIELEIDPARFKEWEAAAGSDAGDEDSDQREQFWLGEATGGGPQSREREFVDGGFWELVQDGTERDAALQTAWKRLERMEVGDSFALKVTESSGAVRIATVGRVTDVDSSGGRVRFEPVDLPQDWSAEVLGTLKDRSAGVLIPIETHEGQRRIFGVEHAPGDAQAEGDLPLNLILYGPPGTGKTYELREHLVPEFVDGLGTDRGNTGAASDTSAAALAVGPLTGGVISSERFQFVTFHQAFGYEDFIEGIRPRTTTGAGGLGQVTYEIEPGVFMRAVQAAIRLAGFQGSIHEFCSDLSADQRAEMLDGAASYALFIDEINRGNVARVFGELITLIESTKRLGAAEELTVTLPTSGARFGVPSNLHIVGTMNTADRGVEALDTALRRRFAFKECPPMPELLDDVVVDGNVEVGKLLRAINGRLLKLLDRDHLIGHAYFMPLVSDQSFDRLQGIFRDSIVPLLQEYFYGDWGRIGLVLGKAFVRRHERSDVAFADFYHEDADGLSERATYELVDLDTVTDAGFRSIYLDAAADDSGL